MPLSQNIRSVSIRSLKFEKPDQILAMTIAPFGTTYSSNGMSSRALCGTPEATVSRRSTHRSSRKSVRTSGSSGQPSNQLFVNSFSVGHIGAIGRRGKTVGATNGIYLPLQFLLHFRMEHHGQEVAE